MANGNQQPTFAGQKVSPAMARAVSAFSASLEAEGQRRSRMGLSGAGFAAGFKEAMSPIIDYSDMLEGNAAPGTVLFDAAMKSAEDKNKKLESKGVGSLQVDEDDEEVGGVPDLLARPVETEEADVVPNTIRQAVQKGLQEGTQGADAPSAFQAGPPRPANLPFNMLASLKRYNPTSPALQRIEGVLARMDEAGPTPIGTTPSQALDESRKLFGRTRPGAVGSALQMGATERMLSLEAPGISDPKNQGQGFMDFLTDSLTLEFKAGRKDKQ